MSAAWAAFFRPLDKGVTWTYFPNKAIDGAPVDGGFFPTDQVTQLSLSVGNINPANGTPLQNTGRNVLLATTYGRGEFVIHLSDNIALSNGDPLSKYAVNPVSGPHVVSIAPVLTAGLSTDQYAS